MAVTRDSLRRARQGNMRRLLVHGTRDDKRCSRSVAAPVSWAMLYLVRKRSSFMPSAALQYS
jgi:hypothetical protein